MIKYFVSHRIITSDVFQEQGNMKNVLIATFHSTKLTGGSSPKAHEERAEEYARILNGQEFYREPPTKEFIEAHSYAGYPIPRAAITSRNEAIDDLQNFIIRVGRLVDMPGGWGEDFERLFARIQERLNAR